MNGCRVSINNLPLNLPPMMNERATKRANSTRKYSRNSENVIEMLLISDIIKHIKLFRNWIIRTKISEISLQKLSPVAFYFLLVLFHQSGKSFLKPRPFNSMNLLQPSKLSNSLCSLFKFLPLPFYVFFLFHH